MFQRFYIMISFFCIVVFFLVSKVCLSEGLTIEQLIAGANHARSSITSGEMRLIVTIDTAAKKSPEESQAWIEEQKKRYLKDYLARDASDPKKMQEAIDSFSFLAKRFHGEYREIEESNVAFRIFDQDSLFYPEAFQYKMTQIDRREMDMYSKEAKYTQGGYFRIITYDGQTQSYEAVSEYPLPSLSFANKRKYAGFLYFELHGRSLNRIPSDAKLVGRETIAGADCYVLEFQPEKEGKTKASLVRVWVDAQKQFCILKEERLEKGQTEKGQTWSQTWEMVYGNFQKYGEIWFPSITQWTLKSEGKVNLAKTFAFKEVQFNLDFPPDFFQVKPQSHLNQGLRLHPDSQVPVGNSGRLSSKDKSPSRDKPRSEQALILSCGPNSLLHVCKLLKVDTSFDELARISNFNQDVGTTMLALLQAAKYKHLNPKGIKANVKSLKKVPMPAIAYVKGNHFLVFEKAVSDGVLIFDPAEKYDHYLSSKELSQIWAGELLIFDYKPDFAKSVPRVLADAPLYDFGEALGGSKIKHTFKLKNVGNSTLNIFKVEAPCKCAATIVSKDKIPPGEYGIIEAVFSVPSENRKVKENVYVYTNDPTQSKIPLTFKGTAFLPITTFPKRLFFGKVTLKSTSKKALTVHCGKGKDVQITGVRVNSKDLTAKIVSEKESEITRVEVAMLESMPVGSFYRKLLIDYSYEGQKATHTVEMVGEVLGEFAVSPRNFFFGLVDGEKAVAKTVTIYSVNSQAFKITGVQSDSKYVTAKVAPQEDGISYYLTASINPAATSGELSGEILVQTDSVIQPTIRVPFFSVIPGKK